MSKIYNHKSGKLVMVNGQTGKRVITFIRNNGINKYIAEVLEKKT